VTGGTGFIGRALLERLLSAGWSVHCLHEPGTEDAVADLVHRGLHPHPVLDDPSAWQADVAALRPDVVFHLASLFLAEHRAEDVEPLVRSNILFGCLLLDAATGVGCRRLVNIGTSWQHFEGPGYDPVCLYAATKQAFEDLAEYYVQARGLNVVTLKLFDTYGPGDTRRKLVPALIRSCRDGGHLGLSGGEQEVDLVYVDDVVRAIMTAAGMLVERSLRGDGSAGRGASECYAVETGEPVSLRGLVGLIETLTNARLDVTWGERPYRDREVMHPWSGGRRVPGWKPDVSLRDGLTRVLQDASCHVDGGL